MNDIEEELGEDGKGSGVERENDSFLSTPFDPSSISIEPKVVPMETLLRRLRVGSIKLAPDFQRKYVWNKVKSSQLIESLMLRIPLPMFYVSANQDGNWDVVDGLQRLTTIRNFILGGESNVPDAKPFALEDLEFWGERFNKKTFADICADERNSKIVNNILETEMRFTVINPGTPEEVKRNIFKRINTGGMPLTAQEIRHALYQGYASNLLSKYVDMAVFTRAVDNSVDDSRMAGRELILRFLAFYIRGFNAYTGDMDKFLSDTMIHLNSNFGQSRLRGPVLDTNIVFPREFDSDELDEKFKLAMKRAHEFFGAYAFRKSVFGQRRTPINKALFETWSNFFAAMSDERYDRLKEKKLIFMDKYAELLNKSEFDRAISRDASSAQGVKDRYKNISTLIIETIE